MSQVNQTEVFSDLNNEVKKNSTLPIVALITAVILWGGSFSGMRYAVSYINPWSVMWLRMIIPLTLLIPFYSKLKPKNFQREDLKLLIPMALLQPCLYFLLESNALTMTTSTQAGVISAAVPLFVSFGAFMFLSEKISSKNISGLIICISGVILLTSIQEHSNKASDPILGNLLEILAMAAAAANMIIVKKLSDKYNTWTLTAIQILAGSLFFLPGLFKLNNIPQGDISINLILILFYLGGFVTLGAFGLYNWGISQIEASKASAFINLVPVTAIFLGWITLGETLNTAQSIAAIIVIAGVLLSQKR